MINKDQFIQRARASVVEFDAQAAKDVAAESIEARISPVDMIQDGFSKGMNEVGEKYGAGLLFLPHVIAAADAMNAGVEVLTPRLKAMGENGTTNSIGTVAIGTIEGDVHCIGKDIVAIMMGVAGFNVINMGRDVHPTAFIEEAKKGADFIGSSALMTTTMVGQIKIEELLKEEGLKGKVKSMVGGAPITQAWADKIGADIYGENSSDAIEKAKLAMRGR
ncbi:MAG: dimethylamine corrinoid protein 3 [Methanomassiliicoccus sp.]|nr:dimethylamine corrinoid protein 3 [Methanomassiliicoccus sp.]